MPRTYEILSQHYNACIYPLELLVLPVLIILGHPVVHDVNINIVKKRTPLIIYEENMVLPLK